MERPGTPLPTGLPAAKTVRRENRVLTPDIHPHCSLAVSRVRSRIPRSTSSIPEEGSGHRKGSCDDVHAIAATIGARSVPREHSRQRRKLTLSATAPQLHRIRGASIGGSLIKYQVFRDVPRCDNKCDQSSGIDVGDGRHAPPLPQTTSVRDILVNSTNFPSQTTSTTSKFMDNSFPQSNKDARSTSRDGEAHSSKAPEAGEQMEAKNIEKRALREQHVSHEPLQDYTDCGFVYEAQPAAFWAGRYVALQDRFLGEFLRSDNMDLLIGAYNGRLRGGLAANSATAAASRRRKASRSLPPAYALDDSTLTVPLSMGEGMGSGRLSPFWASLRGGGGGSLGSHGIMSSWKRETVIEDAERLLDDRARTRRVFAHLEAMCAADASRQSLQVFRQQLDYKIKIGTALASAPHVAVTAARARNYRGGILSGDLGVAARRLFGGGGSVSGTLKCNQGSQDEAQRHISATTRTGIVPMLTSKTHARAMSMSCAVGSDSKDRKRQTTNY